MAEAAKDGPGKYDPECSTVLLTTGANTVVLVVIGGDRGNGFSCTSRDAEADSKLPGLLRHMADQIENKAKGN